MMRTIARERSDIQIVAQDSRGREWKIQEEILYEDTSTIGDDSDDWLEVGREYFLWNGKPMQKISEAEFINPASGERFQVISQA